MTDAMRTYLAGLDLLARDLPIASEAHSLYVAHRAAWEALLPPWEPDAPAATPLPWSQVAPGDEVQAPNGTWYRVDSVARLGERMSILLVGGIISKPAASDKVPTRRGDAGRALDVFRAGGLNVEVLTTEVAG